jgi:8-oxo-dGTP diphosphatase
MDKVKVLIKAIILKDGKLLSVKRSDDDYSRPGAYDLPGGKLEFGEAAEDCILREIKEETTLDIKNLCPLHIISELDENEEFFWIEICYLCDYAGGNVELSHEHTECRWVTKEEFLKLKSAEYLMEFVRRIS